MDTLTESRATTLKIGGVERVFDIDAAELPKWIDDHALQSGGFPYDKKLDQQTFDKELERLQIELVKVQFWMQKTGKRVMALFEGRDAAGKGGAIHSTLAYMNPRSARVVALDILERDVPGRALPSNVASAPGERITRARVTLS